jgi:hypothetical protein
MMAKKPEDRYETPAEVAAAVSSALGRGSGTSSLATESGRKQVGK